MLRSGPMLEWFIRLFGADTFMPHGCCYLWNKKLLTMHVASDSIIFLAYASIPVTLVYFLRKRKDLPFSWMFALFAVFIFACGTTHLMEIWTLWQPVYWLSGWIKVITAVSSVGTAILLVRLVPQALAIPSPALLRESLAEKERLLKEVERAQQQLLEVSRRAGMADVATNLLHNVGNSLNTINVTADHIASVTRGSKVSSLREAMDLVKSQPDQRRFLLDDPRGKKMIEYIASVATALEDDRKQVVEDLDLLIKNVEHVKVIVSTQQTLAKSAGVVERVSIAVLIDDALRFNSASYEEHDMRVVRELHDVPDVYADRHRLLQILMNLLSNARHAVKEKEGSRRIVIRCTPAEADHVRIEVEDNGIGIPSENLEKIFNHGFTTKPKGHGFGLHSSACAAIEIGGNLSVRSEGAGHGACFTLLVPRAPPPTKMSHDG